MNLFHQYRIFPNSDLSSNLLDTIRCSVHCTVVNFSFYTELSYYCYSLYYRYHMTVCSLYFIVHSRFELTIQEIENIKRIYTDICYINRHLFHFVMMQQECLHLNPFAPNVRYIRHIRSDSQRRTPDISGIHNLIRKDVRR